MASRVPIVRGVIAALMLAGSVWLGARGFGSLMPLGPFLDPAGGVWSVARAAVLPEQAAGTIAALGDEVRVTYDRRGVPHIVASSIPDAVRALGFVVARDRLFQLEVQTRATAGRMSEWAGESALSFDRQQRRLGLAWSAERNMEELDPETAAMLSAYAEGVNAWIDGMRRSDLPLEYWFLRASPMRWEPVYSLYLLKRMGYTLTYDTHDRWRAEVEALVGKTATDALFPIDNPIQEPIQPNRAGEPRFDFAPLPPPKRPDAPQVQSARSPDRLPDRPSALGSNNWAVAPGRTADGHALLAGDPHLNLTLPSIWYEAHLLVPGELDVYGVTIPGVPAIVIGFNRDVAWSFTNTGADVLDYYRETLDDSTHPTRYRLDGQWRPLDVRIEEYRGPRDERLAVDTIYATHRGPLMRLGGDPLSMRWLVLEDAGANAAFLDGNRARSVDEWLAAMEAFHVPAQNGIVADREGNIAIRSLGQFPVRPGNGDGTEIRDGSRSASDWRGFWPLARLPFSRNPAQGYLASANQQPIDPAVDDRYLGVNWPSPWRAMRINAILRAATSVTPDDMRRFQTDPENVKANLFVPAFLAAAERVLADAPDDDLGVALRLLRGWDGWYTKDNERAVLFETAMERLPDVVWDELVPPGEEARVATPGQSVLYELLQYPESEWWDDRSTAEVETRDAVLAECLVWAYRRVRDEFGPPEAGGWRWSKVRHANISHLLGFPAWSALGLPIQGGSGNLNPSSGSGSHGASWRMVVDLGTELHAWSTYPGGQSGNPASPWYEDRIPQWVDGELGEVLFPADPTQLGSEDVAGVLTLRSGRVGQ